MYTKQKSSQVGRRDSPVSYQPGLKWDIKQGREPVIFAHSNQFAYKRHSNTGRLGRFISMTDIFSKVHGLLIPCPVYENVYIIQFYFTP
uniref:Uncharacterized protein n=1 Tax=Pyxicephalus adspersus TaxID=30357 RepID=A0AAV3ARI1_PYXAD|nr:TPA: hypothetical protein GDO54_008372 [Pyxicephalus adspersus]